MLLKASIHPIVKFNQKDGFYVRYPFHFTSDLTLKAPPRDTSPKTTHYNRSYGEEIFIHTKNATDIFEHKLNYKE